MTAEKPQNKKTAGDFEAGLGAEADGGVPKEIEEWMGRTLLLYGIPFNYLVPDERMLPPESIRFFYLDPGWLKCVLEGASSVGRSSTREETVDRYLINSMMNRASGAAAAVRSGAREGAEAEGGELHWPLTGYLLRSQVVEGWQGLEMRASGVDQNGDPLDPLETLRIDRLGPDVMLCIFNGKVKRIEIKQPPEGLHFGASPKGDAFRRLSLRKVVKGDQAGDQIQLGADVLELPMRDQEVKRVVRIADLAEEPEVGLAARLRAKKALMEGSKFTSAEFALQMVESPAKVVFAPEGEK